MRSIGPAKMLKSEAINWLQRNGYKELATAVDENFPGKEMIKVSNLQKCIVREDVRRVGILRYMECDVCQYCEITNEG